MAFHRFRSHTTTTLRENVEAFKILGDDDYGDRTLQHLAITSDWARASMDSGKVLKYVSAYLHIVLPFPTREQTNAAENMQDFKFAILIPFCSNL